MRHAHTVAQVRAAEEPLLASLPEGTLMQRAATALAVVVRQQLPVVYGGRVVLLVGSGNNGADALWAGVDLAHRGAHVVAVLAGEPVADAFAALLRAGGREGGVEAVREADVVVDGLVGIGARGPLRAPAAALVHALAQADATVVAVDVPSGVDADTGVVGDPAVTADITVTFGALKPGLLIARHHVGDLRLVEIGLTLPASTVESLENADVAGLLPVQPAVGDKFSRGVLGVAAGSQQYTGAAVLCTGSAVRAGAGMVRFAGASHSAEQVRAAWPETVVTEATGPDVVGVGRVQAWVVGPGLGTDEVAERTVQAVLSQDVPVLVDADGLTVLAKHRDWLTGRSAPTVLTPHDREFERFGREIGTDRVASARALAQDLGVHVLLKGDATVITGPSGPVRINATGTPVLATAGTGDVLSGGIGALLASGLDVLDAASVGAHLHGLAGQLSADGATTSASRVVAAWPDAVRAVRAGRLTA